MDRLHPGKQKNAGAEYGNEEDRTSSSNYAAENITVEKDRIKNDAYLRDINAEWLKRVMSDIYIQEAFNVMTDYINLVTHKTN